MITGLCIRSERIRALLRYWRQTSSMWGASRMSRTTALVRTRGKRDGAAVCVLLHDRAGATR
jgi:hypothetical protein